MDSRSSRSPSPDDTIIVGFSTIVRSNNHSAGAPEPQNHILPPQPPPLAHPSTTPSALDTLETFQKLTEAWGQDSRLPPNRSLPSETCPGNTKTDINNTHAVTRLGLAGEIPLKTLYDETGCLGLAAASINKPPRRGPGVSEAALALMHTPTSTPIATGSRGNLGDDMAGTGKPGRPRKHPIRSASEDHKMGSSTSGQHRLKPLHIPSRPDATPQGRTSPTSQPSTPSFIPPRPQPRVTSPSFEARRFQPVNLPPKPPSPKGGETSADDFDPPFPSAPKIPNGSPIKAHASLGQRLSSAQGTKAHTSPSNGRLSGGSSPTTPPTVNSATNIIALRDDEHLLAKIRQQLGSSGSHLTCDVINKLQSLPQLPKSHVVLDTQYMNPKTIPAKLPRDAEKALVLFLVVHHPGSGHWTLLRFQKRDPEHIIFISHYDADRNLERDNHLVSALEPWLGKVFPGWGLKWGLLDGPRLRDHASSGVLTVLAFWELLKSKKLPQDWMMDDPRRLCRERFEQLLNPEPGVCQEPEGSRSQSGSPSLEEDHGNDSGICLSRESSRGATIQAQDQVHHDKDKPNATKRPWSGSMSSEPRLKKARRENPRCVEADQALAEYRKLQEEIEAKWREFDARFPIPEAAALARQLEAANRDFDKARQDRQNAKDKQELCIEEFSELCDDIKAAAEGEEAMREIFEAVDTILKRRQGSEAQSSSLEKPRKRRDELQADYVKAKASHKEARQAAAKGRIECQQAEKQLDSGEDKVAKAMASLEAALAYKALGEHRRATAAAWSRISIDAMNID